MGDFDSIKIGVCDCYWTPPESLTEVFLGLTKGGCDLTYTPQWTELQIDRLGTSSVDSVLTGETLSIKIPLAETDMNKLSMFAHTGTLINERLAFGLNPGFRLGKSAGRLRLHPIYMGSDRTSDVLVYKAVNKAPLNLQYKLESETIYSTEFIGMLLTTHVTGSMLFAIGDSTKDDSDLVLAPLLDPFGIPSNLMSLIQITNGRIWISPSVITVETMDDSRLNTIQLNAYTELSGIIYNVTSLVTFAFDSTDGVEAFGTPIIIGGVPSSYPINIESQNIASDPNTWAIISPNNGILNGSIMVKPWDTVYPLGPCILTGSPDGLDPTYPVSWRPVIAGDQVNLNVIASCGTLSTTATVIVSVVGANVLNSIGTQVLVFGLTFDINTARTIFGTTPTYTDLTGMTDIQILNLNIQAPDIVVGGSGVISDNLIGSAIRLGGIDSTATQLAIQDYFDSNPTLFS